MSELVGLKWGDVIAREKQVQLSVFGKGGLVRQMLRTPGCFLPRCWAEQTAQAWQHAVLRWRLLGASFGNY